MGLRNVKRMSKVLSLSDPLDFGKYHGVKTEDVIRGDPEYMVWVITNTQTKLTDFNKYLFTIPETAQLLSCSPATVYKWLEQGRLLCVYPTTRARITKESISHFVELLEREAEARVNSSL